MIRIYSKSANVGGSTELNVSGNIIARIALIDDDGNELTGSQLIKYVNLPKVDRLVTESNGYATGTHQLDREVWCKVCFRNPGYYTFKILIDSDNSSTYTIDEMVRNKNFAYKKTTTFSGLTSGPENEIIINGYGLFLSQAGGNVYTIKAMCGRDLVECATKILTKRILFYTEIKMLNKEGDGVLSSITNDLSQVKQEFKNLEIELIKSFDETVDYMPNIDRNDHELFANNIEYVYRNSLSNKYLDPFCSVIVYSGHLAMKGVANLIYYDENVGPGQAPLLITISRNNTDYEALWNKIDHPDDDINEWYINCTCTMINFVDGEDIPLVSSILIEKDKCTPISIGDNPYSCCIVSVDVSHLPKGIGDISLDVYVVNAMIGGLSFEGINTIFICTRSWWKDISTEAQNIAIMHEIGHQIGMVPDGTDNGLNRGVYQYFGRGHVGSHCHAGIPHSVVTDYVKSENDIATCVMYGRMNIIRDKFCPVCASQVKKVDISKGIKILEIISNP